MHFVSFLSCPANTASTYLLPKADVLANHNALCCPSNTVRGCKSLYTAAVLQSRLNCKSPANGSAMPLALQFLHQIRHCGATFATGAFRMKPVGRLVVEAGTPPLRIRCQQLQANYIADISGLPNHPNHHLLLPNRTIHIPQGCPKFESTVGIIYDHFSWN